VVEVTALQRRALSGMRVRRSVYRPASWAIMMLLAGCGGSPEHSSVFDGAPNQRDFEELKANIQGHGEKVEAMKVAGNVQEGRLGYLVGVEKSPLPLEQRQLVQQENVWREKIFEMVGQRTGHAKEEVAAIFAKRAEHAGEPSSKQ
jgi:uncharacterized protein YdbL (DUF1318 family)